VLYTIGHGALPMDALLRRLQANGVRTVLDVRSQPHSSRSPHFSRPELEAELIANGIGYRWLGEHLGGKSVSPDRPAPIDDAALLSAGITEAAALARGATSALLCAELDPTHCHRHSVLADRFEAEGFPLVHILEDGSTEPHQSALDL